jgi:hypothetical protein
MPNSAEQELENNRLWRMWKARNVRNDEFGNPVPVWISDIRFLELDRPIGRGWRVATGTRFGDIRIYDTFLSKRPIINISASYHPICNLWLGLDDEQLMFTDAQDTIGKIDTSTGKIGRVCKCIPGSALAFDGKKNLFAVGGLDKCLTVYDMDGRLRAKCQVESKVSAVWILDETSNQGESSRNTRVRFTDSDDEERPNHKRQRREG